MEVAQSIVLRGFFPNEPLLAIRERERTVVVEGNRRLAALKALREPSILEGAAARQIERLARRITDINSISKVPMILAPSRSEEHTSELQSLMRISYAVFCLKKKKII